MGVHSDGYQQKSEAAAPDQGPGGGGSPAPAARRLPAQRLALRVALTYGALAGAWIILSDSALAILAPDLPTSQALQTAKGWLFVVVTSFLLYLSLRRELRTQEATASSLSQTQERLSGILETIPDGIVVVGRRGELIFANPVARRLLRLVPAGEAPRTGAEPGNDLGHELPLEQTLRSGEAVRGLEHALRDGNGEPVLLSINAAALRDEAGKVVGAVASLTDITRSKPLEEALRESEERFRALVQYSYDVILLVNADGIISYTAPAVERVLGYSGEQLRGRDVITLVHPDEQRQARSELSEVLDAANPASPSVFRVLKGDGTYVHLEVVGSNLLGHPRVGGIVLTARDVSERKQADDAIAGHARQMEALYETSLEITARQGLTEVLEAIVQRAARILGARMGGLYLVGPEGTTLRLAVSHDLPGSPVGTVIRIGEGLSGRAAQMGKPMMVEDYSKWVGRSRAYEGIPFRRVLAVPLKRAGKLIGVLDVTDDQKAGLFSEDEVRLVTLFADQAAIAIENARLLEEAQRRAAYLEAVTVIAGALRTAQTRPEMPPILLEKLMSLVGAEATGLLLWDSTRRRITAWYTLGSWEGYPAPDLSQPRQPVARALLDGQTVVSDDAFALLGLPQPQSAAGPRAMIAAPLVSEERVIGALSVARQLPFSADDVRLVSAVAEMSANALHRAGIMETLEVRVASRTQELADANLRLQELDRLKSEFVSNVSHELRTPITNIMLYLDLLASTPTDERRVRYLDTLRNEAERLGRLIEDLLTLSRIERGVLPVDQEKHALDPLLSDIVVAHMAKAASKGVQLTHEPNDHLPVVSVNRERIAQVFNNLLANALAYGQPGGVARLTSQLVEVDRRRFVCVAVFNDGPPIDPADLPHVFERFYRGQAARLSGEPGTGLGLAISKEIVELHGGRIEVESTEELGTTFTVWLPAAG